MTHKEIKNEIIKNLKIKDKDILQKVINELDFLETSEGLKGKNNLQDLYDKWQKNKDKIGNKNNINSWTAYALGMTSQKPTGDFLPSRRFFARPGPPDIDTDFDYEYQHIIYEYIIDKYGRDNVSNVGTHGVLKLRSAITRICKVLDIANAYHKGKDAYITENQEKVKEVLNEFPKKGKFNVRDENGEFKEIKSIEDAYRYCKDFKYYLDKYPDIKKYAKDIEGIAASFGMHAAGIVLSDIPIYDICPRRLTRTGGLATQFAGEELEKIGLVKFDILAISTLTAISKTLKYVKENYGIDIDIKNLPLDDKKTLELYRSGKLLGVFQCESYPMQKTMMDVGVDRFEDIAVVIALFRPGPMASIPEYCNRKKGINKINYFHPSIEPFVKPYLEETYGILAFQECVMQICNSLAGFTIFEGYELIKGIGKKKADLVHKFTKKFIAGCVKNGVPENIAKEYWERFIIPFSGYGFNKCVSGNTIIYDYNTGEKIVIKELYKRYSNKCNQIYIHSFDKNNKICKNKISDVYYNGKKPVWKIILENGREIISTKTHRFMTINGWKEVKQLNTGDRVAIPRIIDICSSSKNNLKKYEIICMAHLIAEGNLCHPGSLYFYNKDIEMINDFIKHGSNFKKSVLRIDKRKGLYEIVVNLGKNFKCIPANKWTKITHPNKKVSRSGMFEWANKFNLLGKKAYEKSIPDIIFKQSKKKIALFLGRLWSGDGHVSMLSKKCYNPFYATSSFQLATDVQDLLLRFGIMSTKKTKRFKYQNGIKTGYTVQIYGINSLSNFIKHISPYIVGSDKKKQIKFLKSNCKKDNDSWIDSVDPLFFSHIKKCKDKSGETWENLEKISKSGTSNIFKGGYSIMKIRRISPFLKSNKINKIANGDISWNKIKEIKYLGKEDTYDICVENAHNYIANGIVTHNSHSVSYSLTSYLTAYLKANYTEEFMCAFLNAENERKNHDKILLLENDLQKFDIELLPKKINSCGAEYRIVKKKNISQGINKSQFSPSLAVKGVGKDSAIEIEKHAPYKDLKDLIIKTDSSLVNQEVIGSLFDAGFFNDMQSKKKKISKESILEYFASVRKDMKTVVKKGGISEDLFGE